MFNNLKILQKIGRNINIKVLFPPQRYNVSSPLIPSPPRCILLHTKSSTLTRKCKNCRTISTSTIPTWRTTTRQQRLPSWELVRWLQLYCHDDWKLGFNWSWYDLDDHENQAPWAASLAGYSLRKAWTSFSSMCGRLVWRNFKLSSPTIVIIIMISTGTCGYDQQIWPQNHWGRWR